MTLPTRAERCPSCRAPRGLAREYCLECGSRLVEMPARPIHWLWPALGALALAAGGGAVAATASRGGGDRSTRTIVATQRLVTVPTVTSTAGGAQGKPTTKVARTLTSWPGTGYTIVLATIPVSKGAAAAKRKALAALRSGLRQVGVLVSSSYPGLHPGYFIVFAGVYGTLDEAESALPAARPSFPGAYARLVAR